MQRVIPLHLNQGIKKGSAGSDFVLFTGMNGAPIIITQPGDGILKLSATEGLSQLSSNNGRVSFIEGYPFSITVAAIDPSNVQGPLETNELKYEWFKNGATLYEYNVENDGKGTNTAAFSETTSLPGISGTYTIRITNKVGTVTTTPLEIAVYSRNAVPKLYKNLIANGNAELGLNEWEITGPAAVYEYDPLMETQVNFGSIQSQPRTGKQGDAYITPVEERLFRFSKSNNWVNFPFYYQNWSQGTLQENVLNAFWKWYYINQKPNLVPNEDPGDEFASFYPSKRFMDDFNENTEKLGLLSENANSITYFTREVVKFNEPTTTTYTQLIELEGLEDFADGFVNGTGQLVGQFFAYAGIGVNSYTYKISFNPVYRVGPLNDIFFQTITNTLYQIKANADALRTIPYSQNISYLGGFHRFEQAPMGIFQQHPVAPVIAYRMGRINLNGVGITTMLNEGGSAQGLYGFNLTNWKYAILKQLYIRSTSFRQLFHYMFLESDQTPIDASRYNIRGANATDDQQAQNRATDIAELEVYISQRLNNIEDILYDQLVNPIQRLVQTDASVNAETNNTLAGQLLMYAIMSQLVTSQLNTVSAPAYEEIDLKNLFNTSTSNRQIDPVEEDQVIQSTMFSYTTRSDKKELDRLEALPAMVRGYLVGSSYNPITGTEFGDLFNKRTIALQLAYYESVFGDSIGTIGVAQLAEPDLYLNTMIIDGEEKFRSITDRVSIDKISLQSVRSIELIPKCNDTMDIALRHIGQFGDTLKTDIINGPSDDDIMAVKERVFLVTGLQAWLKKTADLSIATTTLGIEASTAIPVSYKRSILGYIDTSSDNSNPSPDVRWIQENYTSEYLDKLNNLDIMPDNGAAAFFALQKKINVPTGTRSIEVKITMKHNSNAYEQTMVSAGIDRYTLDEIPSEHLTNLPKYYRSNNPRIGVANMKFCLYDGEYKRSSMHPTYFLPPYHIWEQKLTELRQGLPINQAYEYNNVTRELVSELAKNARVKKEIAALIK